MTWKFPLFCTKSVDIFFPEGPTELPVKTKTQGVVNPIQTIHTGQVVPAALAQAVPSMDYQNSANRAKLPFRTVVNQPAPAAPA